MTQSEKLLFFWENSILSFQPYAPCFFSRPTLTPFFNPPASQVLREQKTSFSFVCRGNPEKCTTTTSRGACGGGGLQGEKLEIHDDDDVDQDQLS